jgi:alanyl-tRNA synthetase
MTQTTPSTRPTAAAELRRAFLDFFTARGHTEVPSSPLVPNDPTLLFTTAGMVQFKSYYTSTGDLPYTRAVSVQKCLRLTDLENVGLTPRHDTFFEMLGNFSFGPRERGAYFKEEAIAWAWEFVTQVLALPKTRLYPSIFEGEGKLPRDDEAIALWKKMGVAESHIVPLGRKDNFWGPAGGQGACGPCSEIYFDLGETRPDYLPEGAFWGERPGDPGDRYMEFWNLVFPQFDAQLDGTLNALPRPGIDTGMGIERLSLIMQGKNTIFDTDVFAPMVAAIEAQGVTRPKDPKAARRDARIIADHVRALTFAIGEGALPGNEGAGYVLRRLLRRAVTRGRSRNGLHITHTFLVPCAEQVIRVFGDHYRELHQHAESLKRVLGQEEAAFSETYESGMERLERLLSGGSRRIDGDEAFALHDTYGFPIELTEEIALERGVTVDREGFERAMGVQRERARAASKFAVTGETVTAPWLELTGGPDSLFIGYDRLTASGLVPRRWRAAGDAYELVLDRTPAYAESGGQVADRGVLSAGHYQAPLLHVYKEADQIVHRIAIPVGEREGFGAAALGSGVAITIDPLTRAATQRHHTATHLLHAALRSTLGTHVRQAGSLVAPDRLRFDYTHFEHTHPDQLATIERMVVDWVLANREVSWRVLPIAEAKTLGAMALFGEKYGAEVRMVTVPGVEPLGIPDSRELCGGTHVGRTGDIGAFVLVSDGAVASGVRRIEALCGVEAFEWNRAQSATLHRAATALQTSAGAVPEQIEKLRSEITALRKTQSELQKGGLETEMTKLADSATVAPGGRWAVGEIGSDAAPDAVRDAADKLRGRLGRGAAVLALQREGKLTFVAAVSDDLVAEKKLNASELVKRVAQVTGGSGGGKPHLALAGGKDATKLGDALDEARRLLAAALGG